MIRDAGRLMDDSRFKQLAAKHEEHLVTQRYGQFVKPVDLLRSLEELIGRSILTGAVFSDEPE